MIWKSAREIKEFTVEQIIAVLDFFQQFTAFFEKKQKRQTSLTIFDQVRAFECY